MAWQIDGHYFENCSCETPCPCSASFALGADYDRCKVVLAFHVDSGEVEGVDVSGRTVAAIADAPQFMLEGNWRLGMVIDDGASDEQADKLGAVFGGQKGGPMEALAPLIGEMLGVERTAIDFSESNGTHSLRIEGEADVDFEIEDVVPFGIETGEPVKLVGVFHPASSTLTISKATRSRVNAFGIEYEGKAGFSAPFSWAG